MTEITKVGACKQCSKSGACRCVVCKTWYCSKECQADHWPTHWRECLPLPDLEWPVLKPSSGAGVQQSQMSASTTVRSTGEEVARVGSAKIIEVSNDSNVPSPVKPATEIALGPTDKTDDAKNCSFLAQAKASPVKQQPQPPKNDPEINPKEPVKPAAAAPAVPSSSDSSPPPATSNSPSGDKMYEGVTISEKMADQVLTKKTMEILPVDEANSPNNFVIRLADQEQECLEVLGLLNEHMPGPDPGNWKIGRKELVAVLHDELWYRAMAVKKSEGKFQCYLLDFGNVVTISQENMRPLPEPFISVPPFAYQVCLAGVGPLPGRTFSDEDGAVFKDLFSADEEYIFVAEFLGQVEGGRFLVILKGKNDNEEVSKLLIEAEMCAARKDKIAIPIEEFIVEKAATEVIPVADPGPVTGPVVPRGSLKPGTNGECGGVCYFDNPDTFWVCESQLVEAFAEILTLSQDAPEGKVNPVTGTCCLALDDETCWYRAEILGLTTDKTSAKVFLLDYGKVIEQPVKSLKPLPESLASIPGLVVKVKLDNVQPNDGSTWSKAERDAALLVLDVGGETIFNFKNVKPLKDGDGVTADLEDTDGNDLAAFMVDAGCAIFIIEEVGIPQRNVLQAGEQELFILAVESPTEMYLCSNEQFDHYSETMLTMICEAAEKAPPVSEVKVGDKVIVYSEDLYYRAIVLELMKDGNIKVEFIDLATEKDVSKSQMRKADSKLFKLPMLPVKCSLDSWIGKDEKDVNAAKEHIKTLMDVYDKVTVSVKDSNADITKITIPSIEEKLAKKLTPTNVARANLLKLKMKKN